MEYLAKLKKLLIAIWIKLINFKKKRNKNLWVFGEWFGERCGDNCTYFANYIAENTRDIELVWVAKKYINTSCLNHRIYVVEMDTEEAFKVLGKAGVAFMGQGFKDFSTKGYNYLSGALVVNLWHGMPWKKIGHDGTLQNNSLYKIYAACLDWAYGADLYLAPSEKYYEITKTAFGARDEQILKVGIPRNTFFYKTGELQKARKMVVRRISELTELKLEYDIKIITYMPTFRKEEKDMFSMETLLDNDVFLKLLEEKNVIIVEKAHFVNQERTKERKEKANSRWVLIKDIGAQQLLAATDILVTDYSSCFFDYLLLNRPIIHFLYDYEMYSRQDRGLYYTKEEVACGSIVYTSNELLDAIKENLDNTELFEEKRMAQIQRYITYESPRNNEIIYEEIVSRLNK